MSIQQQLKEAREKRATLRSATEAKSDAYMAEVNKKPYTEEIRSAIETLKTELEECRNDEKINEDLIKELESRSNTPVIPTVLSITDPMDKAAKDFSILRFLQGATDQRAHLEGFEKEMHEEAVKEMKESTGDVNSRGFGIPAKIFQKFGVQQRAQSAGTGSEGGYAVATDLGSLIPTFYPRPIVSTMGATVLTGLQGNLAFPRDTALFTMAWETETSASDDTSKTFQQVSMSPKRMAGRADISRRLIAQSSFDIESWMQQEFRIAVNSTLDAAAINGSGLSNQPTGILGTSGIGIVMGTGANGNIPTWTNIVNLEKEIFIDNADEGSLAYLTTPGMRALLKYTAKNPTYMTNGYIMESDGTMNGYMTKTSTNVPNTLTFGNQSHSHAIIFGNWRDLMVGQWGGIWVLPDPYTQATTSQVRIHCELQCDVLVRRPSSFSAMKDAINNLSS